MGEEVSIDLENFLEKVSSFKTVVNGINSSIRISRELEKTNLEPFLNDLETTIDAIKLLERYKQMLNTDIDALRAVGIEMEYNDQNLARVIEAQNLRA